MGELGPCHACMWNGGSYLRPDTHPLDTLTVDAHGWGLAACDSPGLSQPGHELVRPTTDDGFTELPARGVRG